LKPFAAQVAHVQTRSVPQAALHMNEGLPLEFGFSLFGIFVDIPMRATKARRADIIVESQHKRQQNPEGVTLLSANCSAPAQ
jgi:hypothetical protein